MELGNNFLFVDCISDDEEVEEADEDEEVNGDGVLLLLFNDVVVFMPVIVFK